MPLSRLDDLIAAVQLMSQNLEQTERRIESENRTRKLVMKWAIVSTFIAIALSLTTAYIAITNRHVLDRVESVTNPDARKQSTENTQNLVNHLNVCIDNYVAHIHYPAVPLLPECPVPKGN